MGRHHHQLSGGQAQQACGAQIDLGVGLVMAEQLGRQHAVPGQAAGLGHVDQQRHIAIGERGQGVALAQPGQAGHAVGPGLKAVPGAVELVALGLVQRGQAETRQQVVQGLAVLAVDVGPGLLTAPHPAHRRLVAGAPGIGQRWPVGGQAEAGLQRLALADQRAAPIDHGAEDVEDQGAHVLKIGGHGGCRQQQGFMMMPQRRAGWPDQAPALA